MKHAKSLQVGFLALILAGCSSEGSSPALSSDLPVPVVHRATAAPLASGLGVSRAAVVNYLERFRDRATVDTMKVTDTFDGPTGFKHVRLEQEVGGLPVYGAYARAAFDRTGSLVHVIDNLSEAGQPVLAARVSSRDALDVALGLHAPTVTSKALTQSTSGNLTEYQGGAVFFRPPSVRRVAVALTDGRLHVGFLVETWTDSDNMLHHTLVGPEGQVLRVELRTNTDSYNVFPNHPGNSTQTIVAGPGAGNTESPSGWLSGAQSTVDITGNNVHAYLDTNDDDASDGGGTSVVDGNFLTVATLTNSPATASNRAVAVQNLFYLNNVIHDRLYRHGFREGSGNFQVSNFGKQGLGNDAVHAEAQDGGGTNNANFATPSDGSNPRMQMYLWTHSTPYRDGDVDSDIVWHEYGHGLTWRMIGGMSGSMSGAIGEGMSDSLSIVINDDDIVGEYSYNDPTGIRSARYAGYPRTYGDMTGSSVHYDGEIYAATIWRLWELFQDAGISKDTLLDYVVGGMSFTPSGPAMEDMRDGILAAASGTGQECIVWQAFAEQGIGEGAKGSTKGGGPFGMGRIDVSESFAMPAACGGGPSPECTTNAECDDTDPCTVDTCLVGACSNVDDGSCATSCNGNGVCEPGEDCSNCSSDCAGVLSGKPSGRYCCGDGTAQSAEGNGDICQDNY